MLTNRSYHHGDLRRALLERAGTVLQESGADALSLRKLARDIGVSHAAPARHFPDRQALLDALAADGFDRLRARLEEAAAAPGQFDQQVRCVAGAYVDFATTEANLLELLFAHNKGGSAGVLDQGAVDAFAPTLEIFRRGQTEGRLPAGDPVRLGLIFIATLQGIAVLANSGITRSDQLRPLIDEAVTHFLRGVRSSA
ncbi:MAG TPA: TetR/AcrR family transcriptional regulator [Pseudonocardia sp.]